MSDALSFLLLPFAASVAFVLIHAYLGVHVLRRKVVFADLALAQLSALEVDRLHDRFRRRAQSSPMRCCSRRSARHCDASVTRRPFVSQEAFVGILYVFATARRCWWSIVRLGADTSKNLMGGILTIGPGLHRWPPCRATLLHWLARRPLLAIVRADNSVGKSVSPTIKIFSSSLSRRRGRELVEHRRRSARVQLFDRARGHRLPRLGRRARVCCRSRGARAYRRARGSPAYVLDLPTGAAMVTAFTLALVLAGMIKALAFVGAQERRSNTRFAARALLALGLALILASSVWLMVNPVADQPLAALVEGATGIGPAHFLSAGDRDIYESATRDTARFQREVDQLNAREKAARFQADPLSDEEIRRIASYQQSFNEMERGERFVQEVLRGKARARERWMVGLPAALIALLGLGWLARPYWRRRLHPLVLP
jgi:zinc/manganese transport system permease protein